MPDNFLISPNVVYPAIGGPIISTIPGLAARFVLGEGVKPGEGMTAAMLLSGITC
jgi:hypothetical protein